MVWGFAVHAQSLPASCGFIYLIDLLLNLTFCRFVWLEHYLRLGVELIYVIDHASKCPVISHIADFVDTGVVEYTYITVNSGSRQHFMNLCFSLIRREGLNLPLKLFAYFFSIVVLSYGFVDGVSFGCCCYVSECFDVAFTP